VKPVSHFLMSNYYSWKYPATPHDFRIAVPPDAGKKEFQFAAELFLMGVHAWKIRRTIMYAKKGTT